MIIFLAWFYDILHSFIRTILGFFHHYISLEGIFLLWITNLCFVNQTQLSLSITMLGFSAPLFITSFILQKEKTKTSMRSCLSTGYNVYWQISLSNISYATSVLLHLCYKTLPPWYHHITSLSLLISHLLYRPQAIMALSLCQSANHLEPWIQGLWRENIWLIWFRTACYLKGSYTIRCSPILIYLNALLTYWMVKKLYIQTKHSSSYVTL